MNDTHSSSQSHLPPKWYVRVSHPRYLLFLAVLVAASAVLQAFLLPEEGMLAGFDLAVLAFVSSCIPLWRHGNADMMRRQAHRDDAGQILLLVLTGLITTIVLVALALLILDRNRLGAGGIVLLVATLLASWTFSNVIYAFHYARMFYAAKDGKDRGGLDFPGDDLPCFADFVNFALVIGMTCQTADIAITGAAVRRVSTFHGLFAFAFNLGILALTVNVLASSAN